MATNPARSILLIEDDADLCALMKDFFASRDFDIESANDGRAGLARALRGPCASIGWRARPHHPRCHAARDQRLRSAPTNPKTQRRSDYHAYGANGAERSRHGTRSWGRDYLPKPFEPGELLARIRAVLRRSGKSEIRPQVIDIGSLKLDPQSRTVWRGGDAVSLTSIQFDILEILMRAAGRVVSRDEITTILYQRPSTPYERSLDVHISHIRKKIEDDGGPMIQTVRGHGYVFTTGGGGLR